MVITQMSADQVLRLSREALGLSPTSNPPIDDAFLAALLRRAAGILCPCSPSTLVAAVVESLAHLSEDKTPNADRVALIVEALIVGGDILELSQVTIDDPAVKGTWVFAAPPSFVVTTGGTVLLIGVARDETTPLPGSLSARVEYEGFARILSPQASENLPSILRDLGFVEFSLTAWLKAPRPQSASEFRDDMLRRLLEQPPSGAIPDISILDSVRNVDYYAGRWVKPKNDSGNYVARRPQAYGAPLWGFASLMDGDVIRFLDFPLKGTRWRGCDLAWHLQMAIDHCRGTPQLYRCRPTTRGTCVDFFSPLPLWAQRRLGVLGQQAPKDNCLLSYLIPEHDLASEETFLQDRLWLTRREKSE